MNNSSLAAVRLAGRPLAIAPARLDGLIAGAAMPSPFVAPPPPHVTNAGIAVVPILGPLFARGDWLTAMMGATNYSDIAATIDAAAREPSIRGILLDVDSPGGEVGGLFDLTEQIQTLKEITKKPLWAVAGESALSAAYAIASAADRIYVTRTGEVGSVGVVAVHIDESGADAMTGLKWTLIRTGERKTDGNPHEPLSPRAHADIQADVDRLYGQLVDLVAANRGMTPEAVRATEAAVYRGTLAVDAGLADRIGTVDQALADLAATLEPKRIRAGPRAESRSLSTPSPQRTSAMTDRDIATADLPVEDNEDTQETETPEEPIPQPAPAALASTAAVDADAVAAKLRAEYGEIAGIAAQASRLGVTIDAADAMRQGLKPDALRRSVLDALAARSEAADIVAATPPTATAGESPIVKRARERASAGPRT